MQLAYCQKLDAEADPINKIKTIITIITIFSNFKINQISFSSYNAIKILPKIGFRSGP